MQALFVSFHVKFIFMAIAWPAQSALNKTNVSIRAEYIILLNALFTKNSGFSYSLLILKDNMIESFLDCSIFTCYQD